MLVCSCSRSSFFCSAPNSCNSTHCKSGQKFLENFSLFKLASLSHTKSAKSNCSQSKQYLGFPIPDIHACICVLCRCKNTMPIHFVWNISPVYRVRVILVTDMFTQLSVLRLRCRQAHPSLVRQDRHHSSPGTLSSLNTWTQ